MMQGRDFLEVAWGLLDPDMSPAYWRGAIIHAYYALLLECREAMTRWKLPTLARYQVHAQVRLRLTLSSDPDLKEIGNRLEELGRHRNSASYDLRDLPLFASEIEAIQDVQAATDALALLDAIDPDPVRRAVAVASIKP